MLVTPSPYALSKASASLALASSSLALVASLSTLPRCVSFSASVKVVSAVIASLVACATSSIDLLCNPRRASIGSPVLCWFLMSVTPLPRASSTLSAVSAALTASIAFLSSALTALDCSSFSLLVKVGSAEILSFVALAASSSLAT